MTRIRTIFRKRARVVTIIFKHKYFLRSCMLLHKTVTWYLSAVRLVTHITLSLIHCAVFTDAALLRHRDQNTEMLDCWHAWEPKHFGPCSLRLEPGTMIPIGPLNLFIIIITIFTDSIFFAGTLLSCGSQNACKGRHTTKRSRRQRLVSPGCLTATQLCMPRSPTGKCRFMS